ncbi:MAG: T9SS type A sorting domain-containing protein [bacterium]
MPDNYFYTILFISAIAAEILLSQSPPVYVVLFTHIEDNTPIGILGSPESRQNYTLLRSRLIALANLARSYNVRWSFQPDWKILLAALQYEDAVLMQTTNNKNVFRYLKEDLNVVIDPHSHENGGYNYTDVAYLLDSLGVGGSTVIGGHIWDPSLLQFQNWDRFRVPVTGLKYSWARWRGDILMGSGTPNHVNDPVISGVWRPKNRFLYFVDDPAGNITCVGQYKGDIAGVSDLVELYTKGIVSPDRMLTSSMHIPPTTITQANGLAVIEDSIIKPWAALRNAGSVVLTDFTSLIMEWKSKYEAVAFLYDAKKPTPIVLNQYMHPTISTLQQNYPNPCLAGRQAFNPSTTICFTIPRQERVKVTLHDMLGREIRIFLDEIVEAGTRNVVFDAENLPSGVYVYRLVTSSQTLSRKMLLVH